MAEIPNVGFVFFGVAPLAEIKAEYLVEVNERAPGTQVRVVLLFWTRVRRNSSWCHGSSSEPEAVIDYPVG